MEVSNHIKITAYFVVGVVSLIMFTYGVTLPSLAMKLVGALPLVCTTLFTVFDRWVWHWKWLLPFVGRPWLGGTWSGKLTSYRTDDEGKATESEHEIKLRISQTFTTLSVSMMTGESKSRSLACQVKKEGDGFVVFYQYDNNPELRVRSRSPRHWGAVVIELNEYSPLELNGEYWTNRDSKGTFVATLVSRKKAASFNDGQSLVSSEGAMEA